MIKTTSIIFLLVFLISGYANSQKIYFPPIDSDRWDTISINELGWKEASVLELINFLEKANSKAFILLKDGKIVIEKYFGSFNKDSIWYWASAGKTLTAALVGIAQEEGLLKISDRTSKFLGDGWTSLPRDKEELITLRHQLTMTTGFDYKVDEPDCTKPECLKYKADAGTQWYYHNAPYTLLERVVENASGKNYNIYFSQKIRNSIGMSGAWIKLGYNNVYFSNARSMARFGILILNNGFWDNKNIIKDKDYLNQMINTSQDLNKSYGYLWWLNGKVSYMIPGTSKVFNSMLMPDAPSDVFAALGKDGQCLNISPQNGFIWVRMGEKPDTQFFISTDFSNEVWKHINRITEPAGIYEFKNNKCFIYPNPANEYIEITYPSDSFVRIYNTLGECVMNPTQILPTRRDGNGWVIRLDISALPTGVYYIISGEFFEKFLVVKEH